MQIINFKLINKLKIPYDNLLFRVFSLLKSFKKEGQGGESHV